MAWVSWWWSVCRGVLRDGGAGGGQSAIKPFCDGTHANIGFSDAKDPERVPGKRDTYVGQQVTIFDNRGICQHSGFCTGRLATVFRLHDEPFVAPSGGRMDEIIRAVRDCPSGALSYALDGEEARAAVDHHGTRKPMIAVSKDGPYRVTGDIPLIAHDGIDIVREEGASGEHYALCRCGHSQNKPFCSGMHWYAEFRDPVPGASHDPSIFEWAGGLPALTRMTPAVLREARPAGPALGALFAGMSADHPERVAKWLAEVFCGPTNYSKDHGGYPRMLAQHLGKELTEDMRERWVALLLQSAREAGLPNDAEFRSAFEAYIEWGSRRSLRPRRTTKQLNFPPLARPCDSKHTSNRCFGGGTERRCSSPSTYGPTTTSAGMPQRSLTDSKPERCRATAPGPNRRSTHSVDGSTLASLADASISRRRSRYRHIRRTSARPCIRSE